jgi:hypothetical protein
MRRGGLALTPTIFVFGSNLAGRHGKGAARWARKHRGAIYGQARGRQGQAYAIPTKDMKLKPLPLRVIRAEVEAFLGYARERQAEAFLVTAIGCGLAGYSPAEIGPMFENAPPNVDLPPEFVAVLGRKRP